MYQGQRDQQSPRVNKGYIAVGVTGSRPTGRGLCVYKHLLIVYTCARICAHTCAQCTDACVLGTLEDSGAKVSGSSSFLRALYPKRSTLCSSCCSSRIFCSALSSCRGLLGAATLPTLYHPRAPSLSIFLPWE